MTASRVDVHVETYLDSLLLMAATVRMDGLDGVEWAGAVMASPSGLADLAAAGFSGPELDGLDANDLVLAVRAAVLALLGRHVRSRAQREQEAPVVALPGAEVAR